MGLQSSKAMVSIKCNMLELQNREALHPLASHLHVAPLGIEFVGPSTLVGALGYNTGEVSCCALDDALYGPHQLPGLPRIEDSSN